MYARVRSLGLKGIGGYEVQLEVYISSGLPRLDIVGLPDASVKEAGDRVRAAIKNSGYDFPVSRITVNLAPADTRKVGTIYDLPILLGILAAGGQLRGLPKNAMFIGELSLTGEIRPVAGALPMAMAAKRAGVEVLYVPAENAAEAAYAAGINVFPVRHVRELVEQLSGEQTTEPMTIGSYFPQTEIYPDFADVKGQENIKRAMEIAAAGGHNLLMVGPPGAGKSMLAKRLPGILPDMSREEILRTTEIWSVAGLTGEKNPIVANRPFRAPHSTASRQALTGGAELRPGEMSLANNGVLFLDELPEFHRDVLEVLRQPLEEGEVTVSRAGGSVVYPADFMLVCAMNPCRCGWYGHPSGRCRCTEREVHHYQQRVSGPLLDRIDLMVEVQALEYEELKARPDGELSASIKERVDRARSRQRERFNNGNGRNARMSPAQMEKYCALNPECSDLMKAAFEAMGLTARSYDRIRKVARTIADLAGSEEICPEHLAEAIQYRSFDFREAAEES